MPLRAVEESDTVTLYAEPDESSDMLFHYYSGTVAEAGSSARVDPGAHQFGEAALRAGCRARAGLCREEARDETRRSVGTTEAGEQAVYAAPDENAKVLRQTLPVDCGVNGIGTDDWVC
ncbi:MAG: hypothetical protein ACLS7Z_09965 [Christensenellales bacterium]